MYLLPDVSPVFLFCLKILGKQRMIIFSRATEFYQMVNINVLGSVCSYKILPYITLDVWVRELRNNILFLKRLPRAPSLPRVVKLPP